MTFRPLSPPSWRRYVSVAVAASCLWPCVVFGQSEGEAADDEIAVPSLLGGSVSNTDNETGDVPLGHRFADGLWDVPKLVDNPDAPFLQNLRIIGRYHGQYANVDSNQSDFSGWETRRARLGINVKFLQYFTLQSVWEVDGDDARGGGDNVFNQWISWRRWDEFGLKFGVQKPLWSQEWSTSSNAILTFERSLLVNQFRPRHALGIYASGEVGDWAYGVGGFRGKLGAQGDETDEDGDFLLFSVAHDFGKWLEWLDDARWRVDYLDSRIGGGSATVGYDGAFSTSISGRRERGQLTAEVLYILSDQVGDAFGFTVTPAFDIIPDKLQFVVRYHHARSDGDVLELQSRYETVGGVVGDGRGDRYNSLYGGLNWYLRGNRLKVMGGLEYAKMEDSNNNGGDYEGWTLFSGVRLSF